MIEKPPTPPEPPESRLHCDTCGYTAPESEFHEKHRCYRKDVILVILAIIPLSWCVIGVITLWEELL